MARSIRKVLRRATAYRFDASRDWILASYPRSGNTWLRAVCFYARLGREPESMAQIDLGVPDTHAPPPLWKVIRQTSPIVKSHFAAPRHRHAPRALYVVRNPCDVLPSYYRYRTKSRPDLSVDFEAFCADVLLGNTNFGSWFEHVTSWLRMQETHDNVGVVTYEGLMAADAAALQRLADFLGTDPDRAGQALALFDRNKMKALEEKGRRDVVSADKGMWFVGETGSSDDRRQIVGRLIRDKAPHYARLMERFAYSP